MHPLSVPNQVLAIARMFFRKPEGFDLVSHITRAEAREKSFAGKPLDLCAHILRAIEAGDIRRAFAKYAAHAGSHP